MKSTARSLRQRLFVLILLPLVLMAVLLGYWRYTVALTTADELFDRSLLAAALAISRDVAISDGDALSHSTSDLIRDAAGQDVFYHVTGPAGAYLTGYAYPPIVPKVMKFEPGQPVYFEGQYRGELVHVIRLIEHRDTDFLSGNATVTVWQNASARNDFAQVLALRALGLIGVLMLTLAIVVWFGVQMGLRPLFDLQEAIAARSPHDLSTIKRAIPKEAQGIVATLNRLFGQVVDSLDAHQSFISDASHQLRNPTAAVLSMAEAVRDANTDAERDQRLQEMISAARDSSRVTEQLLSLERLRQGSWQTRREALDLNMLSRQVCADLGPSILSQGIDFELRLTSECLLVFVDETFVSEALKNLVDNTLKHGGGSLSEIIVQTSIQDDMACITVCDDGVGLSPADEEKAFSRFGQLEPSSGSGLGLAIAQSVADQHLGRMSINAASKGASISLYLPLSR